MLFRSTPAGTEVTGAVSPAVEGATSAPDVTGVSAADGVTDRAPVAKHPD